MQLVRSYRFGDVLLEETVNERREGCEGDVEEGDDPLVVHSLTRVSRVEREVDQRGSEGDV